MTKSSIFRGAALAMAALVMTGCAMKAPPYDASIQNVSTLKRTTHSSVRLGDFTVAAGAKGANEIGLRGGSMTSPVGVGYAAYLADALKQELDLAKRLDPASALEVSGSLLGTDLDAGMSTGSGYVEAKFIVKKDGQVRYEKTKRGDASWDSSFVAAIAVPAAQKNYPLVVQRLLESLYGDADFQNVLK